MTGCRVPRALPEALEPLHDLAADLRWTWSHAADRLWRVLDPDAWSACETPWRLLQDVPRAAPDRLANDPGAIREVRRLADARHGYLAVRALHDQVSPRLFQKRYPGWPQREEPVTHMINGVHAPTWDARSADRVWEARRRLVALARRFTPDKRPMLLLSDRARRIRLLTDRDRPSNVSTPAWRTRRRTTGSGRSANGASSRRLPRCAIVSCFSRTTTRPSRRSWQAHVCRLKPNRLAGMDNVAMMSSRGECRAHRSAPRSPGGEAPCRIGPCSCSISWRPRTSRT